MYGSSDYVDNDNCDYDDYVDIKSNKCQGFVHYHYRILIANTHNKHRLKECITEGFNDHKGIKLMKCTVNLIETCKLPIHTFDYKHQ